MRPGPREPRHPESDFVAGLVTYDGVFDGLVLVCAFGEEFSVVIEILRDGLVGAYCGAKEGKAANGSIYARESNKDENERHRFTPLDS